MPVGKSEDLITELFKTSVEAATKAATSTAEAAVALQNLEDRLHAMENVMEGALKRSGEREEKLHGLLEHYLKVHENKNKWALWFQSLISPQLVVQLVTGILTILGAYFSVVYGLDLPVEGPPIP